MLWEHSYFPCGSIAKSWLSWSGLAREEHAHTGHWALRLTLCNGAISVMWDLPIFPYHVAITCPQALYRCGALEGAVVFTIGTLVLVRASSKPCSSWRMLKSRVIVPSLLILHFPWLSLFYISLCVAGGLYSQLFCMTISYFEIRRSIVNKSFFVPLSWFKLGLLEN